MELNSFITKSKQVINEGAVGDDTETSGAKGKSKVFKLSDVHGREYIWKPSSGEHVSTWRYLPKKEAYKREYAAYLVDKQLELGLVPETKITNYKGEIGSLQDWVKNATGTDKTLSSYSIQNIWAMGIFDLCIANTDRHANNWIEDGGIPVAIDNGFAFPNKAGKEDEKSIILSRFAYRIWNEPIPNNILLKLKRLQYNSFKNKLSKILDKESFDLFNERVNTMIERRRASFPKYYILKKLVKKK